MAIALDNTSSGRNSTGNITVSHVVGSGSNRVLYVKTSAQDSNHANLPVTGITYGGVALTKVRHDEATGNNRTEIWRLIAPAVGTANIVVTFTGSIGEAACIGISLTGVDQTTPTDANNGATGNSSGPSVSITSVTDNAWFLTICSAETTFSSNGTGQTTIATLTDQSYENARGTYEGPKTPAGTDTQSFVIASGQSWALSSVAVRPADTSGTASVSPVSLTLSIPSVTATSLLSTVEYSVVPPTPVFLNKNKILFIVESIDGDFRYSTENWEFSDITREINGSMSVRIKTDQLTTDIANQITSLMNRITIRISTSFTDSKGIDYFSGYIPNRSLNLTPENNSLELIVIGYASRLFEMDYRTGTTIAIDKTAGITASNLAKDVIDKVIALDSNFPINYTSTSVVDSVDTIKDKFILQKAGDVLSRAAQMAFDTSRIWHWVVNGDNVFRFKKDSIVADHNFVYGKHVLNIPKLTEDLQQSKNEILVVYNGGANVKRVVDTDSIALYGLRSETVNESNVPDSTTATEIGNAHLASKIPPIRAVTITIGSDYPIEKINPGDTCRIDGLPRDISNLLTKNLFITKTIYRRDTVDLELSIKNPFIQNKLDIIKRRQDKESVEGIAATTYA